VQAYAFLLVAALIGVGIPWSGLVLALPAIAAGALMLGAVGLTLSVYIRQLENFAGAMNFVIFPMFFLSSALYPLWKLKENGGLLLYGIANANPLTHAIEFIRFSAYAVLDLQDALIVIVMTIAFFCIAVIGYDPQRGVLRRRVQAA
jgi:ABC-2 type transport system permease protein